MYIKYISDLNKNKIVLNKECMSKYKVYPQRVILNFGQWKKEVSIQYDENLDKDFVGLPSNMIKDFYLPENVPYKLRFEEGTLFLGPIIGFLLVSRHKSLTPELLKKYQIYLSNYDDFKGLVYIFSNEGIDIENHVIRGYYYNHKRKNNEKNWKEGVFPYPDALYRKAGFSSLKYNDIVMYLGNKYFNGYFFDKWDMWEWLSIYSEIKKYLPYTERLTNKEKLDKMLDSYNSVYLKKIAGYKAKGIIKVYKATDGYHFIYRLKGDKVIDDPKEVSDFIEEIKKNSGGYIIQQAIDVKKFENRNYDFRVILQKDGSKKWTCTGIIARFGKKESIATNFLLNGFAYKGKEALKKVFKLNEKEAFVKEKEIISICIKACKILDQSAGNYGDLGIDVMIDKNQNIWILEINKLHDHRYPLYALDDNQMYYKVITKPFEYANALAGFNE